MPLGGSGVSYSSDAEAFGGRFCVDAIDTLVPVGTGFVSWLPTY